MSTWNEYIAEGQYGANVDFGLALGADGKFPILRYRIWKTLADLQGWVNDDTNSTACAGLIVTVIKDPTASKNGVYLVTQAAGEDGATEGKVEKISTNKVYLTQAEYDALEVKDPDTEYNIY